MKKRKKINVKRVVLALFLMILLVGGIYGTLNYKKIFSFFEETIEKTSEAYIGSLETKVMLYNEDYTESKEIARGTKVKLYEKEVVKENEDSDNITYNKVSYDNETYLIDPNNVVNNYEEAVYEKEIYPRTSVTVYETSDTPDINGYISKGLKLDVTGFDKINEDGTVNMYKVKNGDSEGYIYSKYTVMDEETSKQVYNENGTYDIHKDRKYYFELNGGYASNLDYYPYEKPTFENNVIIDDAKTFYLVGTSYVLTEVDKYIALAKNNGIDAFVIDIKDGALAYQSEVAREYTMTSYNRAMNTVDFYKAAVKKIQDAGFYTIGRIVLFNDSSFAEDNPDDCILTTNGSSTSWVSAYSRNAWEYNVKLAKEAIKLFDFNEIQFDYVRFPESSYNWSRYGYNFRNNYNEEKAQAIQNFLYYATDQIHLDNKYISIDVFGECSSEYVTAYGQYWPAISNIVDVISAMPYVDHFDRTNSNYWYDQYSTMYNWGLSAATRQKEIPTPAKVRTWITAYNVPFWDVAIIEGPNEISDQIRGLVDAGLGSGVITWNASSSYDKYAYIASAFNKEY